MIEIAKALADLPFRFGLFGDLASRALSGLTWPTVDHGNGKVCHFAGDSANLFQACGREWHIQATFDSLLLIEGSGTGSHDNNITHTQKFRRVTQRLTSRGTLCLHYATQSSHRLAVVCLAKESRTNNEQVRSVGRTLANCFFIHSAVDFEEKSGTEGTA